MLLAPRNTLPGSDECAAQWELPFYMDVSEAARGHVHGNVQSDRFAVQATSSGGGSGRDFISRKMWKGFHQGGRSGRDKPSMGYRCRARVEYDQYQLPIHRVVS